MCEVLHSNALQVCMSANLAVVHTVPAYMGPIDATTLITGWSLITGLFLRHSFCSSYPKCQ